MSDATVDRDQTRRAIARRLATADEPLSGPVLAAALDVSRAAVWKQIEALRDRGFAIESGGDGYRVTALPEFGGAAVECRLDAPFRVESHDRLPSTNDRARTLAEAGREDVVVLADEQTGGRGRLDREWASPSGGAWMSVLLRPDVPPADAPRFTLAAAVASVAAARAVGVDAGIKWPNDVVVPDAERTGAAGGDGSTSAGTADGDRSSAATDRGGHKLAGILTEMEGETNRVDWVVVGIGLNANVPASALPADATSLRIEAGEAIERRVVVRDLLERFHELRRDPDAVLPAWREHALTLGQRVRVTTPRKEVVGEAVDIEPPGTLVVRHAAGEERVTAGDCDHLRPVD